MPGFGRRFAADPRDRNFLMRRMLPDARALALPARKTWGINKTALDQGETGTCVGHGWRNFPSLRAAPDECRKPSAFDIYRSAVLKDPWPDNDDEANLPDGDPGSTPAPRYGPGPRPSRSSACSNPTSGRSRCSQRWNGCSRRGRSSWHQLVFQLSPRRRGHRSDLGDCLRRRRPLLPLARSGYAASARALLQLVGRRVGQIGRVLPSLPRPRTADP